VSIWNGSFTACMLCQGQMMTRDLMFEHDIVSQMGMILLVATHVCNKLGFYCMGIL
jgi:hypothetical protein